MGKHKNMRVLAILAVSCLALALVKSMDPEPEVKELADALGTTVSAVCSSAQNINDADFSGDVVECNDVDTTAADHCTGSPPGCVAAGNCGCCACNANTAPNCQGGVTCTQAEWKTRACNWCKTSGDGSSCTAFKHIENWSDGC